MVKWVSEVVRNSVEMGYLFVKNVQSLINEKKQKP